MWGIEHGDNRLMAKRCCPHCRHRGCPARWASGHVCLQPHSCKQEFWWCLCPLQTLTPLFPCPSSHRQGWCEHRTHLASHAALAHLGPCHLASSHPLCPGGLLQHCPLFPCSLGVLTPGSAARLLPHAGDARSLWMPLPPPFLSHQPSSTAAAQPKASTLSHNQWQILGVLRNVLGSASPFRLGK